MAEPCRLVRRRHAPDSAKASPVKTTVRIGEHSKTVLRFDGKSVLEAPRTAPPNGTLFVVYQPATLARSGERVVGWEDADVGAARHRPDDEPERPAARESSARTGKSATYSTPASRPGSRRSAHLGARRHVTSPQRVRAHGGTDSTGVSSDPKITSLKIGGPGSGGSPHFTGDIAELRVYSRPLTEAERKQVEAELRDAWFQTDDPKKPARDPPIDFTAELLSPRGPFWPPGRGTSTTAARGGADANSKR